MLLQTILLQATEAATAASASLTERLTDQAFSIVLLVGFAVFMLRRQKQLEDKMDKYQEEDRQEMRQVIETNTRALERVADMLEKK